MTVPGILSLVYVAGPFRGPTHYAVHTNVTAAEAFALAICKMGAYSVCPHKMTEHYTGELPDEFWLAGDLALLRRCDAIAMMPNWQQSRGAVAEEAFARAHGIPVFYELESLGAWIRSRTCTRATI